MCRFFDDLTIILPSVVGFLSWLWLGILVVIQLMKIYLEWRFILASWNAIKAGDLPHNLNRLPEAPSQPLGLQICLHTCAFKAKEYLHLKGQPYFIRTER